MTGRSLIQRSPTDCVCLGVTECDHMLQSPFTSTRAGVNGQRKKERKKERKTVFDRLPTLVFEGNS